MARDLARKKKPEAKIKQNKRLRDNRYFTTQYSSGCLAQCEFIERIRELLTSDGNLEKLGRIGI